MEMIGSRSEVRRLAWHENEAMLYAIGVGAGLGDPESDLAYTTENTAGITLRALPSFLTILTQGNRPPAMRNLDYGRFLHAQQTIELPRPLAPSGEGWLRNEIVEVLDKGANAIITTLATLSGDEQGENVIGQSRMSTFVRGGGGFGGPRGTARPQAKPDREPDCRVAYGTRPEQALIYRLSGDGHRLHSDPAFARERGFERPILHGLSTYGFACRAIISGTAGGDAHRLRAMSGRFCKPVYPGDTLVTEIWLLAGGHLYFRMLDGGGDAVIDSGQAKLF
ncbi:hypothetical protein LK12_15810 [Novosphingobium malaysiense]|uniref:Uncharacterized protein n=2 Tax=Novosphingobium malaysiense TaxID=1348853 RepID=A0A0B1ZMD5_9SPHN|nr:hypothetical protein LK12_15810 [Novosphingobium malaysiense]